MTTTASILTISQSSFAATFIAAPIISERHCQRRTATSRDNNIMPAMRQPSFLFLFPSITAPNADIVILSPAQHHQLLQRGDGTNERFVTDRFTSSSSSSSSSSVIQYHHGIQDWWTLAAAAVNKEPTKTTLKNTPPPPSSAEIALLRKAFATFYASSKDTKSLLQAQELLTQTIQAWQRQPPDEQASLYRVRGDCYMVRHHSS